ncbi:MAG: hypothetical protein ABJ084_12110 [Halioglobus sp.]
MSKSGSSTQAPSDEAHEANTIDASAIEYQLCSVAELPTSLGFSARLNMLWDLAGVVPSQTEGRISSIRVINPEWSEADLRRWLQRDVLPSRLNLHNMVKFLASQLQGNQNVQRWEAFLIYGSPIVPSPIEHIIYREDQQRRDIASMIFSEITDRYEIPPSSYQADAAFQRCLTMMHKFNIYETHDFQPGHMEPFKSYMFPSD